MLWLRGFKMMKSCFRVCLLFFICLEPTQADIRHASTVRIFKKLNICPSTQKVSSKCPGYVVDHIKALNCGGEDKVSNLQYQEKKESFRKDIWERKGCPAGGWK